MGTEKRWGARSKTSNRRRKVAHPVSASTSNEPALPSLAREAARAGGIDNRMLCAEAFAASLSGRLCKRIGDGVGKGDGSSVGGWVGKGAGAEGHEEGSKGESGVLHLDGLKS